MLPGKGNLALLSLLIFQATATFHIQSIITLPCLSCSNYGTAQFKPKRTCVWHGLDMIHFSFCIYASTHEDARSMMLNLLIRASIRTLDTYVHDNLQMHACMSGLLMYMPNLVCVHFDVYINCKLGIVV